MTGAIRDLRRNRIEPWTLVRVLCATDFSDNAAAALDVAVAVAQATQAKVLVLHVAHPPVWRSGRVGAAPVPGEFVRTSADLRTALTRFARPAVVGGVETEWSLVAGDPAQEIVSEARRARVDLIVIGRHSQRAPGHWLVGSVTERVVRTAPCPVLVVKPSRRLRGRKPRHVVCALDLGETSAATLAHAATLTNALQAVLLVIHVVGLPRGSGAAPALCGPADAVRAAVQEARAHLDALIAGAPVPGPRVQQRVMVGTPRDEILVAAGDSDVVVVGSHAGGILDRQFIGSTTLHLLRGLGCDVLVVPARVAEAEGPDRPRPREEP